MEIRRAVLADAGQITDVEAACFPPAEAATGEEFEGRLNYYADCFWLLFDDEGRLVSFIDGMRTDEKDLRDEMYARAELHQPDGQWQMIFGVTTLPECRKRGYAGMLMEQVIRDTRERGCRGLVLTCKDRLVHYYAKFGYEYEGLSESVHGDVTWYQMRLTF